MSYQTNEPFKVASIADNAMDSDAMGKDYPKYMEERNPELVKSKPGMKLTWFYLKPISTSVLEDYIEPIADDFTKYKLAFQFAVSKIENLYGTDGKNYPSVEPAGQRKVSFRDVAYLDPEQMDLIPTVYKKEIGQIAYQRSFLAHTTSVYYLPPPWLVTTATQKIAVDAVNSRKNAQHPNTNEPQEPTKETEGSSD